MSDKYAKRVLFVCTANICRSPMAETIFDALASDAGLPYRARSAGTEALKGKPMAPYAVAALREVGFYPEAHRARQVTPEMVAEADLVLTMTPQHAAALHNGTLPESGQIYTLPNYATDSFGEEGISDPYGLTMVAYRSSVRQLHEYLEQVVLRIMQTPSPR